MEVSQPRRSRAVWSRLDFWSAALSYLVLMMVLEFLLRTPLVRDLVEEQSRGLLKPAFDYYAGGYYVGNWYAGDYYDVSHVTSAVVDYLGVALYWAMLAVGFITSVVLWRFHRTMALGVFSAVAVLFGLTLLFLLFVELTTHRDFFSRLPSSQVQK